MEDQVETKPLGRPPLFGRKMQRVNTTIPIEFVDYMRENFGSVAEAIRVLVEADLAKNIRKKLDDNA